MQQKNRIMADVFPIFGVLAVFFLLRLAVPLNNPPVPAGDEFYYVRGARAFCSPSGSDPNFVHPPLGKMIISVFMRIFGDNPFGWRAGSLLFGALTVILAYQMGLLILRNRAGAFFTGILVSVSFLNIVHSRIATLDIYAGFFMLGGIYYSYMHFLKTPGSVVSRWSVPGAAFLGFSLCCKLSGASAALAVIAFFLWCFFTGKMPRRNFIPLLVLYGGLISGIFLLCHVPLFIRGAPFSYVTYSEVRELHYKMNFTHPALTSIDGWFYLNKPFWYYYVNNKTTGTLTGILGYGNYIFWWGFPALFLLKAVDAFRHKNPRDVFIVITFLCLYLFWLSSFQIKDGVFRFKGGFIYYMLPMIPFMSLTVANRLQDALFRKSGKLRVFIYFVGLVYFLFRFYPLLTAVTKPYAFFNSLFSINIWVAALSAAVLNLQLLLFNAKD